jgi:hypothetical protein
MFPSARLFDVTDANGLQFTQREFEAFVFHDTASPGF